MRTYDPSEVLVTFGEVEVLHTYQAWADAQCDWWGMYTCGRVPFWKKEALTTPCAPLEPTCTSGGRVGLRDVLRALDTPWARAHLAELDLIRAGRWEDPWPLRKHDPVDWQPCSGEERCQ